MWENIVETDRPQGDNMAHAPCMLDSSGYKYTHIIRKAYYFSSATMVARTRLSVTSYQHCLSCSALMRNDVCSRREAGGSSECVANDSICNPVTWKCIPLHTMKAYRGSGGTAPSILNLGTRWRCQPHAQGILLLQEELRGTHSVGGWVCPIAVLDISEKRLISPAGKRIPHCPARSVATVPCTISRLPPVIRSVK